MAGFRTQARGGVEILHAASLNVEQINAVIEAAKRSWNYDEGYLEAAIPLLRIERRGEPSFAGSRTRCFTGSSASRWWLWRACMRGGARIGGAGASTADSRRLSAPA